MKKTYRKIIIFLAVITLFTISQKTEAQFYNGIQMSFGKNRVQFKNNFWTYYRFDKFDVYFYTGGKPLAGFTAKYASEHLKEIEDLLDFQAKDKIQFIVYKTLSDLKQTNIGLLSDEQYNVGGITHILENKVFIYYDGELKHFEQQIRAGLTKVMLNQLIYGASIATKIKNNAIINIPNWWIDGLTAYISEGWNTHLEHKVKNAIESGKFQKFNHLNEEDAVLAGHSIWKYINDVYGEKTISNLVYMTKVSRNIESGYLYVLGLTFKTLIANWLDYYSQKFQNYPGDTTAINSMSVFKTKKNLEWVYSNLKLSPDGKMLAYTTNQMGKHKIWVYQFDSNKKKRIYKKGQSLEEKIDYSYPVLAWHPAGNMVAYATEEKGNVYLYFYDVITHKKERYILEYFDKVLDLSFSQDAKNIAMSVDIKGQTDIVVYNLASRTYFPVTNDVYDDLNPRFINNSKDIVFSSNRINDTIKKQEGYSGQTLSKYHDIFLYHFSEKSNVLINLTKTPAIDETHPLSIAFNKICFLSNKSGIYNRYFAKIDSTISSVDTITHYRYTANSFPITDYTTDIEEHDVSLNSNKWIQLLNTGKRTKVFFKEESLKKPSEVKVNNTPYAIQVAQTVESSKSDSLKAIPKTLKKPRKQLVNVKVSDVFPKSDTSHVDINNYSFNKQAVIYLGMAKDTIADSIKGFVLPKQRNYDVQYSINQLVTQVDFSFLNTGYQQFTGGGSPIYLNPGFNALIMVGVNDLLEDYRMIGGVRLSPTFDENEYMFSFENLKNRTDKQWVFHRQTQKYYSDYFALKQISTSLHYILKYPFNEVFAVKCSGSYRYDQMNFLSTDMINLQRKGYTNNWVGLKGEFIFDNTRYKALNIYYGTRWKVFGEYYQTLEKNNNLIVFGFDYRNYKKISKLFIWANRIAGSMSLGNNKLIYYMGGVDNWLFPTFDTITPIDYTQSYAYQTLATNMRGFQQNIRNGSTFAVINSELRFPVFKYFIEHPMRSEFLNNFQIVGFGDVGSAWNGWDPYSEKNALYTWNIQQGPFNITVHNQVEPIVGGFGFGLRSKLLGYFMRADYAWGVENYHINKPVFYLSLSLDF